MQSLSKAVIVGALMFSVCTLAHSASKKVPQNQFAAHAKSEGITILYSTSKQMLYIQDKPIQPNASIEPVTHKACASSKKKNELYELSAIFNDKLQLFLSYFDEHPTYQIAEKTTNKNDLSASNNVILD